MRHLLQAAAAAANPLLDDAAAGVGTRLSLVNAAILAPKLLPRHDEHAPTRCSTCCVF